MAPTQLRVNDPVIYSPLASGGHYRGKVLAVRPDQMVDIELSRSQTGVGDAVALRFIPVVDSLADLAPGTCTLEPA